MKYTATGNCIVKQYPVAVSLRLGSDLEAGSCGVDRKRSKARLAREKMIRDSTEKVAKAWREEVHGHRKLYSKTVPSGSELTPWKDWRPRTSIDQLEQRKKSSSKLGGKKYTATGNCIVKQYPVAVSLRLGRIGEDLAPTRCIAVRFEPAPLSMNDQARRRRWRPCCSPLLQ